MTHQERKPTIFLAEDEDDSRFAYQLGLEMSGFAVVPSKNGEEMLERIAMACLEGEPIDLIMTDLQMPGLSGKDLIDRLLNMGVPPPILVISGFQDVSLVRELMKQGCSGYINKPFTIDTLVSRIESAIEQAAHSRAGGEQGTDPGSETRPG